MKYRKKYVCNKAICYAVVLILAAWLCACGRKAGEDGEKPVVAFSGTENVYRVDFREIQPWIDSENPYIRVKDATAFQEGICAAVELREWAAGRVCYGVLTVDEELSDIRISPLQSPGAASGQIVYDRFAVAADERLYGLCSDAGSQAEEGADSRETTVLLCCWDTSGSLLWESDLSDLCREEDAQGISARGLYAMEDGFVYLLLSGRKEYLLPVSQDGQPSGRRTLSDQTREVFADSLGIWPGGKESLQVLYPDAENREKTYVARYDINADTWGEPWELPFAFSWGEIEAATVEENRLVYAKADGVWSCENEDAQETMRVNYVNSDVNITGVDQVFEMDEKRFLVFYREDHLNPLKVGVFSRTEPGALPEKQVIVLGGSYIDERMRQQVVAFNRANDACRIVLKEYTYDEINGAYTQFALDIAAGNMPDILLAAGLPVDDLIGKGLAADIRPLLEGDAELAQKEFMQNVFDAYSVDGKLWYVVPDFMVATAVAKTSLVGDAGGWDLEEAKRILANMGEGTQFMSEITRDLFIDRAMQFRGRDFVDVAAGKCFFDSEEFIALMEFAAALPEEIDRESLYEGDYWEEYDAQYRDNRTLLKDVRIDWLDRSVSYELIGNMGEDFRFVGFPGAAVSDPAPDAADSVAGAAAMGDGAYIYSDDLMVLSANSANLEGAWQFVRYYLTEEYQSSLDWGLPVDRNVFLEQTKRLTVRDFYTDENGEKVEYDDIFCYHGEEIPVPPMTQEQVEEMIAHIESVNNTAFRNEEIMCILREELGSYFSGQKKAEDVAALIQNRVQLYLDENIA